MMASPAELTYFLEVANTQNLSRASERLGISQPSLSAAIKRLEDALGTDLFTRHKRGVTLTQAGKQLLAHTKQLLHYWVEIKSQALASQEEVQGRYTIGAHPSVVIHHLAELIPDLLVQYPKLDIQFRHDISRKITEQVINLSIDIGIVVNPIKHPDLIIQKLCDDEYALWVSTRVKNANQDLQAGTAVIICDSELSQPQSILKQLNKKGIKYGRILNSSNLEVIARLTTLGAGIGILPAGVGHSVYAGQLKSLPKMPGYHDEICLVYRHENRGTKAMQVMMNAIKSHFKARNDQKTNK